MTDLASHRAARTRVDVIHKLVLAGIVFALLAFALGCSGHCERCALEDRIQPMWDAAMEDGVLSESERESIADLLVRIAEETEGSK